MSIVYPLPLEKVDRSTTSHPFGLAESRRRVSLSPLRKLTLVKIGSALSHSSRVSFNRSLTSSSPSLGGAQLMKTAAAAAAATKFTTTSFRGVSMKTRH